VKRPEIADSSERQNPVPGDTDTRPQPAWFCLRSQPKREHLAAAQLRANGAVDVFLPRIRYRRKTQRGTAWVTEALFPNYLFARFDWKTALRQVHHSPGVTGVVHFGVYWPTVPDATIGEMRALFGTQELHVIPAVFNPGDEVHIAGGAFHGLTAVVRQMMPARQRVNVLLDFLGRQLALELPLDAVVKTGNAREAVI
jgi:transcriptional antiterminator RfaH